MQNEADGIGGGLLTRAAPEGVGIVPSVLRQILKLTARRGSKPGNHYRQDTLPDLSRQQGPAPGRAVRFARVESSVT